MKRGLVETCIYLTLSLFSISTYAHEDECDCYMEYEDLKAEARVYEDKHSRDEALTEFTAEQKRDIQEATNLMAEG